MDHGDFDWRMYKVAIMQGCYAGSLLVYKYTAVDIALHLASWFTFATFGITTPRAYTASHKAEQ